MSDGKTHISIPRVTVFVVALVAVAFGFAIGGLELHHALDKAHPLQAWPFVMAAAFITIGALVIQSGDIRLALQTVVDLVPILQSLRPGGRRATDPPAEEPTEPRSPTPVTVRPTWDHDREPEEAAVPHEPHEWRDGDPREGLL